MQHAKLHSGEEVPRGLIFRVMKQLVERLDRQVQLEELLTACDHHPKQFGFKGNPWLKKEGFLESPGVIDRSVAAILRNALVVNQRHGIRLRNPVAPDDDFVGEVACLFGSNLSEG